VKEVYDAVPGSKKEFLVMKNATHARIPVESWEEIVLWLNKTI
jgi:acylglycerol lipase